MSRDYYTSDMVQERQMSALERIADALEERVSYGWRPASRRIDRPEDLADLRPGAVVLELDDETESDPNPCVWVKIESEAGMEWQEPGSSKVWMADSAVTLPVMVLWEPSRKVCR